MLICSNFGLEVIRNMPTISGWAYPQKRYKAHIPEQATTFLSLNEPTTSNKAKPSPMPLLSVETNECERVNSGTEKLMWS